MATSGCVLVWAWRSIKGLGLLAGLLFSSSSSQAAQAGVWRPVYSFPNMPQFSTARFCDASHGFLIASSGEIFDTQDGGRAWSAVRVAPPGTIFSRVACVSALEAFILAHPTQGRGAHPILLHTVTGGKSWRRLSSTTLPATASVMAFSAASATRLFVATDEYGGGHLWRSDDGGHVWTPLKTTLRSATVHFMPSVQPSDISLLFTSDRTGWARVTTDGQAAKLAYTTDGGTRWTDARPGGLTLALDGAPTPSQAYATDSNGLYRTDDDGKTWARIPFPPPVPGVSLAGGFVGGPPVTIVSMQFPKKDECIFGTSAGVFLSSDGGRHVTQLPLPHVGRGYHANAEDQTAFVAAGASGRALYAVTNALPEVGTPPIAARFFVFSRSLL